MYIQVGDGTDLQIALDLPEGMNGRLEIGTSTDISVAAYGWAVLGDLYGNTIYRTSETSEPLLDITVDGLCSVAGYVQN